MSDIAFVAAPRICPPGARAKVSILFPHRPLTENPWLSAKDSSGFPRERTHPACGELEKLGTLEACAPREDRCALSGREKKCSVPRGGAKVLLTRKELSRPTCRRDAGATIFSHDQRLRGEIVLVATMPLCETGGSPGFRLSRSWRRRSPESCRRGNPDTRERRHPESGRPRAPSPTAGLRGVPATASRSGGTAPCSAGCKQ